MKIQFTDIEARVIGCLLEKETTTPDQYPLSLNALVNACNQKSNRDPVMTLSDRAVQEALDSLAKRFLISDKAGYGGGRTPKYKHRFCNTEFGGLKFTLQERGILCALLLRGPQTPGELRTHTQRLCDFAEVGEVEAVLTALITRDDGPFAARLPRAAGSREFRFMHQFCGELESVPDAADSLSREAAPAAATLAMRVAALESQVAALQRELEALRATGQH